MYKEIIYMGENNRNQAVEPDLNQIRKNKREKLANLQAAGKDPFVITKYDQTHHSVDAKNEYVEHEKELIGDRPWRPWPSSRATRPPDARARRGR